MLSDFSPILLQGSFWPGVWPSIVAGLILNALGWMLWGLWQVIKYLFKASRAYYRITGIWIAPCKLPRFPSNVEAIEIYRLNRTRENVAIRFFQYRRDTKKIVRYEGAGIYRDEVLSAFYYIADPQTCESGVFVVRKVGEKFKGVYAQYDLVAGMEPYQSPEDFILRRIQISLWAQFKMSLRLPPFSNYDRAKGLYDKACAEQPAT